MSLLRRKISYINCALANVHEWSPSLSVLPPRMKNVHGALANVHEWSLSLLSPSFVEQVARRFVESLNLNIIVHVQVKFADLKFMVSVRFIKHQTYKRTAQ